ncbi:hypothetical protein Ate01nite_19500 [Actinoplanes teichomyceticus]|nr:hypothetical protein Ate01nite_19500 [Actinoplanes teichomyceticus]
MGERLGVPVQSDQDDVRVPLQDRLGVAAQAQREVDVHRSGPGESRTEQLEAALQKYRNVRTARLPHVDPH